MPISFTIAAKVFLKATELCQGHSRSTVLYLWNQGSTPFLCHKHLCIIFLGHCRTHLSLFWVCMSSDFTIYYIMCHLFVIYDTVVINSDDNQWEDEWSVSLTPTAMAQLIYGIPFKIIPFCCHVCLVFRSQVIFSLA